MEYSKLKALLAAMLMTTSLTATAGLVTFETYTGSFGVSTDGVASTGDIRTVSASIPAGSTISAAYLYTATQDFFLVSGNDDSNVKYFTSPPTGVTLNGTEVSYDVSFPNFGTKAARNDINLSSHRADVTSIVQAGVDTTLGGIFNFDYSETNDDFHIDGSGLVIVYEDPALSVQTVAILNGAQNSDGDTFNVALTDPIDLSDPGQVAEMVLGINFSAGSQASDVVVNGTLLTDVAGSFDDGINQADGQLITVGSFDDPFSGVLPTRANDHERYNLLDVLPDGTNALVIDTVNPTDDDNIFLAVLTFSGEADITTSEIPLPAGIWLMLTALGGLGVFSRRNGQNKA